MKNVLRCSGTPRISGKLFTGLSVGRTAALCIIVIQTGRQMHAHTPATRWAHSPVLSCGEKKSRLWWWWWKWKWRWRCSGLSLLCGDLPSLSRQAPVPDMPLFPGMMSVPRRAELFWSGSERLLGPFRAAGAAGAWRHRGRGSPRRPIGAQEEEGPPERRVSSYRCTSETEKGEKEEKRRLTRCMKMSPERRDLVPVETINSSLQWLPGGPRASRGLFPSKEGPTQ